MKSPNNGGEFWGFNEESDEENYSFDEDEENTAGFKPILKVREELGTTVTYILSNLQL